MSEIKVVGKVNYLNNTLRKKEDVYWVKRKNRANSLDVQIMKEFGCQSREACEKTCSILNNSRDNFFQKNIGWRKSLEKKYYYFPTSDRQLKCFMSRVRNEPKKYTGGKSLNYKPDNEIIFGIMGRARQRQYLIER